MKNNSVYKEAMKVTCVIFILGLIEFICFTLFKAFQPDILLGVLYGCAFASLNFFYLAFCVNQSVKRSESAAKAFMGATYTTRILLCGAMIIIAAKIEAINIWAAIIPLFFQRIAIFIINLIEKRGDKA